MRVISTRPGVYILLAALTLPASGSLTAQPVDPNIAVTGERLPDPSEMTAGPEIKGVITARNGQRIKVTLPDGTNQVIAVSEATRIRSGGGLFGGGGTQTVDSLLNGLPVTVKTWQYTGGLVASQITFKNSDLRTAMMIRNGTNQRFEEQSAATEALRSRTEALRSRMGDIDKYNIKNTTNVYFDTGKAVLSASAKADLCATASQAEAMENALILVVGYTDSTGSDEVNQAISDRRANNVIHFLQQACHWKPYRMLTPTGMASADPLADNSTAAGRAQNRRVSVNILVSKSVDGI